MASLFKTPKPPRVPEPPTAPTPDDAQLTAARRRRAAIARQRSGVQAAATLSRPGSRETLG